MTLQQIRALCMSFPNATEQIQWGKDLVFKIGGKMFCVCCTEPVAPPKVALSFKCDDETFAELVERPGVIPAPYMAQHKWVAPEQFDTLGDSQLTLLLARAYEIVSAKGKKVTRVPRVTKVTRVRKVKTRTASKTVKKPAMKGTASRKTVRKPARRAKRAPARRGR